MNFLNKQKKAVALVLVFCFALSLPFSVFAADGPDEDTSEAPKNLDTAPTSYGVQDSTTQSQNEGGGGSGGASYSNGLYSAIGGTATCSAGQILGRIVSSAVGQAVGGITNSLGGSVSGAVKSITKVPVIDQSNLTENQAQSYNTSKLTNKTVGGGNSGAGGILSGIVNSINSVSWDSIMYCIVNEIMTYITQSTIQWINSGFNGNPVFIQNIGAKFQQIADQETSIFMREVSNGASQAGQVAINGVKKSAFEVAQPFRQGVLKSILGSSQNSSSQGVPSSMSPQLTQNYNSYVGGNWNSQGGGFAGLMQVSQPNNNQIGVNMAAQNALQQRIAQAQQIKQSQVVNGTQSFYTCRPGAPKRSDGSCAPIDQIITTPAQSINDETSGRAGMKYMRLSFAKDFDSVVSALVNQLVKIAVNKVYESVQN